MPQSGRAAARLLLLRCQRASGRPRRLLARESGPVLPPAGVPRPPTTVCRSRLKLLPGRHPVLAPWAAAYGSAAAAACAADCLACGLVHTGRCQLSAVCLECLGAAVHGVAVATSAGSSRGTPMRAVRARPSSAASSLASCRSLPPWICLVDQRGCIGIRTPGTAAATAAHHQQPAPSSPAAPAAPLRPPQRHQRPDLRPTRLAQPPPARSGARTLCIGCPTSPPAARHAPGRRPAAAMLSRLSGCFDARLAE